MRELPPSDMQLLLAAQEVAPRAFNPVSRFQVGAAVRTPDGRIYRGTFMEISALPLGVCAEPAALLAALTDGAAELDAIAVVGGDPQAERPGRPVTPCGGCRQRIFDVVGGSEDFRVLCANLDLSEVIEFTIGELLPAAFGPADLPTAAWRTARHRSR